MTVRRGHITFKRDGYVGSLSLGGYGLGRGAAHQETAGMFGGGGHFGEGAFVEGRGGFLERQQSRFIGDIVDRGIGDSILFICNTIFVQSSLKQLDLIQRVSFCGAI